MDLRRELPSAPESERALLCCCLLAEEGMDIAIEKGVSADTFYLKSHSTLWAAFTALRNDFQPITFETLAQYLRDRQQLEQIGGAAYLNELYSLLPSGAQIHAYIPVLLEKRRLRVLIEQGSKQIVRAYGNESSTSIMSTLESVMADLTPAQSSKAQMKDLVMGAVSEVQTMYERKGKVGGLETGFQGLDQLLDGLGQNFYVVAARPSMGKTALGMNIAEHLATNGIPVGVFSLEMSAAQLVLRSLCSLARVNLQAIRKGFLSERDFPALTAAAQKLAGAKLFIDDTSALEIAVLRARARRLKRAHDIKVILIDYLQLLKSPEHSKRREQEIADVSRNLKAMQKELEIPVVALAQINRNPDARSSGKGRPRISDLRESGSIEQDADVIGLIHREEVYCDNDEEQEHHKGRATLIIGKHRNGAIGDVPLTFLKEYTRFEDRAEELT